MRLHTKRKPKTTTHRSIDTILEQYKIQHQLKNSTEASLLTVHKLYITIFSAIITIVSALIISRITADIKFAPKYASIAYGLTIASIVLSVAWLSSWKAYEKKILIKIELLKHIEKKLPISCIDCESKYSKEIKTDLIPTGGIALLPFTLMCSGIGSAIALIRLMH